VFNQYDQIHRGFRIAYVKIKVLGIGNFSNNILPAMVGVIQNPTPVGITSILFNTSYEGFQVIFNS
jgi:predicted membrane-bound mannosyltransferase